MIHAEVLFSSVFTVQKLGTHKSKNIPLVTRVTEFSADGSIKCQLVTNVHINPGKIVFMWDDL